VFAAGANIIFVLVTARVLGPSDRGRLVAITTSASLVSILCAMGVGSAGRYLLASPELRNSLPFRRYARLSGLLAAGSGVLNVGVLAALRAPLGLPPETAFLVLGGLLAALMTLSTLLFDAMNAFGLTAMSSLAASSVGLFGLISFIGLVRLFESELTAAVVGTATGFGVACVVAAWFLHRTPKSCGGLKTQLDLLRAGLRLAPFSLGQAAVLRLDRLLVALIAGPAAAGVYSVAAALSEGLRVVSHALSQRLTFGAARRELAASTIQRSRRVVTVLQASLGVLLCLAAPFVVPSLLGVDYSSTTTILPVLVIGELALTQYLVTSRVLLGTGHFGTLSVTAAVGVSTLIVLDLALIPPWELYGAAAASSISYGILAALSERSFRRESDSRAPGDTVIRPEAS
jgi:O-antigen/teichoic acid export membrane protein